MINLPTAKVPSVHCEFRVPNLQVVISQQELKHFATEAITGKLTDVPDEGFDEDAELPKHRCVLILPVEQNHIASIKVYR